MTALDDEDRARRTVAALVVQARTGDAAAFTHLVERYTSTLARFCQRLLGDESAAEDLAQETFLRAYQMLPRLVEPTRFGAWLYGIAANLARHWWRRHARWPVSFEALVATYPDVPWTTLLPALVTPSEIVEEAEQERRIVDAVTSLPESLHEVVVLHYLEERSYVEIAAVLAVPVSTVKARLFRARALLRAELAGEMPRVPARHFPHDHHDRLGKENHG